MSTFSHITHFHHRWGNSPSLFHLYGLFSGGTCGQHVGAILPKHSHTLSSTTTFRHRFWRELVHTFGGSCLHFKGKILFFFSVSVFSMVESLVLFYRALFLRKPCPIFFYALEGALLSIWREFYSKHYVLGGSVEVPILQSILWPFLQDKVLLTTTLSDHP